MSLLRRVIGGVLRRVRLRQGRTLREVAIAAGVSLPYLSEVERGRKEASSEVLAAICRALGINLSDLLEEARDELRRVERRVPATPGAGLARLDRVPTARRDGTGPHLRVGPLTGGALLRLTPGRRRPARHACAGSPPSSIGFLPPGVAFRPYGRGPQPGVSRRTPGSTIVAGGGTATHVGATMLLAGGPLLPLLGGTSHFRAATVTAPVRVITSAPAVRPAPRTARMLARRRARAGRRRLVAG
ncbi:helix-turn-helix domain-containing protein [Micromonospora sp. NPDC092111]|uniref:helix-turn-helix domain-containing protein n=1 Tax=Micromonospora sp. NPDC092111 TaxID=3364289 RepID=UPI003816E7F6